MFNVITETLLTQLIRRHITVNLSFASTKLNKDGAIFAHYNRKFRMLISGSSVNKDNLKDFL